MTNCPCGFEEVYEECCGRFHRGAFPETAELLMRSRYSAYVVGDLAYIRRTSAGKALQEGIELESANEQSSISWIRLEILHSEKGQPQDELGTVTFSAYFQNTGQPIEVMHEKSVFKKIDGKWFYVEGFHFEMPKQHHKLGRNDKCECGSGKKYKKCCGA